MLTKTMTFVLLLLGLSLAAGGVMAGSQQASHKALVQDQTQPLSVLIPADIVDDFQRFVAGRNILAIDYYGGRGSRREVAELVLLYQALYLGGYRGEIEYIEQETDYLRSLQMLSVGRAAIYGTSVWKSDVTRPDSPFLVSEPLVRNGEFLAGIYTAPDNQQVLNVRDLLDLQKLTAVSSQNWHTDWRSLKSVNLRGLYHNRHWPNMVKMVRAGRADFTLAPLRGDLDQTLQLDQIQLVPVSNTAFALQGSRHWIASSAHPQGAMASDILTRGLTSLRNQGSVARAYRESGFFPAVDVPINVINRPDLIGQENSLLVNRNSALNY